MGERDRYTVLAALACVDYIVMFGEKTPEKVITALRPDVLVKGSDWAVRDIVGASFVKKYGGRIKRVRLITGRSTLNLIKKIVQLYGS